MTHPAAQGVFFAAPLLRFSSVRKHRSLGSLRALICYPIIYLSRFPIKNAPVSGCVFLLFICNIFRDLIQAAAKHHTKPIEGLSFHIFIRL